jgi:hypothetical protein
MSKRSPVALAPSRVGRASQPCTMAALTYLARAGAGLWPDRRRHALGEWERCVWSNCCPLVEKAPHVVHQRIEQDPGHSAVPGGDDRPFVEAANSCSTRTVRRRDGWRPIQTTSGPLLLDGRRPNSTFARHGSENAQYSITPAQPSSSTDAEESLMRPPERRARRAEALAGNHVVLSGRLAARAERRRQKTRQIWRDAGALDSKSDASAGSFQMIENGSLFVISPKGCLLQRCMLNRRNNARADRWAT